MSLALAATANTYSAISLSHHFSYKQNIKVKTPISIIKVPSPFHISYKQNQIKEEEEEDRRIINRRNVLFNLGLGLGLGGALYITATTLTSQDPIATAAPLTHSHNGASPLIEFGSQPQVLDKTIRILVPRPKEARANSKEGKVFEVLVVDGIEVPHDGPVRLDVYMAKAHNDVVGPELGEFAGSLVNMAFTRVGKKGSEVQSKGSLELGISALVKDIEAEECDKVAVTLISRLDPVRIGGLRIYASKHVVPVVEDENRILATFSPHRTATFVLMKSTANRTTL